jgi:hypothetical protein
MPTMVDAWGVSAHCEVCNAEAYESDLEDDTSGRMACGHCREAAKPHRVNEVEKSYIVQMSVLHPRFGYQVVDLTLPGDGVVALFHDAEAAHEYKDMLKKALDK